MLKEFNVLETKIPIYREKNDEEKSAQPAENLQTMTRFEAFLLHIFFFLWFDKTMQKMRTHNIRTVHMLQFGWRQTKIASSCFEISSRTKCSGEMTD